MIQQLPEGYNTQLGESGQALSGGQRQRVALARALYKMPPVIVLDEPNANLDALGEKALVQAVQEAKKAGSTVILITHKTNILSLVDQIVVMNNGQVSKAGPRDQVLAALAGPAKGAALAAVPVSAA